jgi:hypothetical protein
MERLWPPVQIINDMIERRWRAAVHWVVAASQFAVPGYPPINGSDLGFRNANVSEAGIHKLISHDRVDGTKHPCAGDDLPKYGLSQTALISSAASVKNNAK